MCAINICISTPNISELKWSDFCNEIYRKQCVQTFNVFDFLREIVSKVPDLGGPDAAGDERGVSKRRFGISSFISSFKFGH